ncbi:MAG: 2-hydroxyacyl-CoA dehydratase [Deltaproteobacteria bacterium]|nr:2-hydroxyacyl-CoA dehydratase [Deltaproteobacteria bacterium]
MDLAERKEKSLKRYKEERDYFKLLLGATKVMPGEESVLQGKLLEILLDSKQAVVDCVENDKPFIGGYFCNAPELFTAMDLPWFMVMETPFLAATAPYLVNDIEGAEEMGLGTDLCTAIRLPMYYNEHGLMPMPTAVLGLLYPCDGAPMLHQMLQHNEAWKNVPIYSCDPPYKSDERAVEYFAEELRRMADFLTEHTGKTLDMDKLATVCEESNRTYSAWQDYNELRRNVPSPHGWALGGAQAFAVSQCFVAGDPRCSEWFEQLYKCGEMRVQAGKGASETEGWEEKIRLLWFDIMPYGWVFEFMPWLEEEFGAVIVMDMFGNFPYTMIDTSSEETMFHDLAKRNLLDAPMIRQARSTAENFSEDIRRMVTDYRIDCVIWPGHMGHKDGSATHGIMRQTCRELGVPFMHIGLDLFDKRYTSVDEVKEKVTDFFKGMGLA